MAAMRITDVYTTPAAVEAAPLANLASAVLKHLADNKLRGYGSSSECGHNFMLEINQLYNASDGAMLAISEAWTWLQNRDLICRHPRHGEGWITLSRLGRELAHRGDLQRWMEDRAFPDELVHPVLRQLPLQLFRQGHFDTA